MNYLRQNTGVSVIVGPFVSYLSGATNLDSVLLTAGVTASLLHVNTGTTQGLANNAFEVISGSSGNYRLDLTTTNTATTGELRVSISGASLSSNSFLEVWKDFQVVTQNFYDGMFGTDSLEVSAVTFGHQRVSEYGVSIAAWGNTWVSDSGVTVSFQGGDFASSGVTISTGGVTSIFGYEIEGGFDLTEVLRVGFSVLSGKSSGGGGSSLNFRDVADSKNRLTVTVDADGNRTSVDTRDGSD